MTIPTYLKDPLSIKNASKRIAKERLDLSSFKALEAEVAMQVVQSNCIPEILPQLRFVADPTALKSLFSRQRLKVLCDVEAVGCFLRYQGVLDVNCYINEKRIAEMARTRGETRAMNAVRLWLPHLRNAVVVIGNAPTALFRLLELLEGGAPRPSLIIAMPPGFVGAGAAKECLLKIATQEQLPTITLLGEHGGSAMSAAAFNALAAVLQKS